MAKVKSPGKKKVLNKKADQTKWAPWWTVAKIYGSGRKVHPGRHTRVKRHWKRTKIKA